MRPHPNPAYLTVTEAARVLGVSRQRVQALIVEGKLPVIKQHRHLYVPMSAVRDRMAESERNGDMTVHDVAKYHGVTVKAVYHWHQDGRLVGRLSQSRRLRFDPKEVATFNPAVRPSQQRKEDRRRW